MWLREGKHLAPESTAKKRIKLSLALGQRYSQVLASELLLGHRTAPSYQRGAQSSRETEPPCSIRPSGADGRTRAAWATSRATGQSVRPTIGAIFRLPGCPKPPLPLPLAATLPMLARAPSTSALPGVSQPADWLLPISGPLSRSVPRERVQ